MAGLSPHPTARTGPGALAQNPLGAAGPGLQGGEERPSPGRAISMRHRVCGRHGWRG